MLDIRNLPVAQVMPWTDNPKVRILRNESFGELVNHMREHGQIDPIDVVCDGDHFVIVRGHRRFAALADIGRPMVMARIWPVSFDEAIAILGPTEWMHPNWAGTALGQLAVGIGLDTVGQLLPRRERALLRWGIDNLPDGVVVRVLQQFGPRAFGAIRRCGVPPTLAAEAILRHGTYRDIEQKGLTVEDREVIIRDWLELPEKKREA